MLTHELERRLVVDVLALATYRLMRLGQQMKAAQFIQLANQSRTR
jgi:hypothetical protein